MAVVGSSTQSLSFSSWTTPGATCVSSVFREADVSEDEKKWGGGWGSSQPVVSVCPWVKVEERGEGWWKHLSLW